jgi:hypothetical protein
VQFHDEASLRDVRVEYFKRHGLGADGGYSARWARFRIGPMVLLVPNTSARRRALPLHDLHHIATGYDTSWTGEGEIAAWELGSGCGQYAAAWFLNFSAFFIGLLIAPQRTWFAFRRGRASSSLYAGAWDGNWLDMSVRALRVRLGIDREPDSHVVLDALLFAACSLPGLTAIAAMIGIVQLLVRLIWS